MGLPPHFMFAQQKSCSSGTLAISSSAACNVLCACANDDTRKTRAQRADRKADPVLKGADVWQHGEAVQITDQTRRSHRMKPTHPTPQAQTADPQARPRS